jgi:hypothetical protein
MDSSEQTGKVRESNQNECGANKPDSPPTEEGLLFDHSRLQMLLLQALKEGRVARANAALMDQEAKELEKAISITEHERERIYSLANSVDQRFLQSEQNMVNLMIMRVEWERQVSEKEAAMRAQRRELESVLERIELERVRLISKEKSLEELKQKILGNGRHSTTARERNGEGFLPVGFGKIRISHRSTCAGSQRMISR